EELISSQKNLQTIFDVMEDFFIVFDSTSGQILYANKKVTDKLEYSLKTLTKKTFYDIIPSKKKKGLDTLIKKICDGKIKENSLTLQLKSGGIFTEKFVFYTANFTNRKVIIARC
ncbi:MAG: PAS domain S-box protein, partial [Candidatus Heimdallarchaeota archaeon]